MKSSRTGGFRSQLSVDVLRELRHAYDYGLVATYGFDVEFFEEILLGRVETFSECKYLNVFLDASQYDKITESHCGVAKQANRRYLLVPVSAKGRFHPKVYLFASPKTGLLVVGSLNLTRSGLTRNAEVVFYHRYEENKNDETCLPLFRQAFSFFKELAEHARCRCKSLAENLQSMAMEIPWLNANSRGGVGPLSVQFIHSMRQPIYDQILSTIPEVKEGHFLSPYYDKSPLLIEALASKAKAKSVAFYTQNGNTNLPREWILCKEARRNCADFYLIDYEDQGRRQNLHGKACFLTNGRFSSLFYGSANCTTKGLLSTAETGNIEAGLLLSGPYSSIPEPVSLFARRKTDIRRLTGPNDLQSSSQFDQTDKRRSHVVALHEVELEGRKLRLAADTRKTIAGHLILVLEHGTEQVETISIDCAQTPQVYIDCPEDWLSLLSKATCTAYVAESSHGRIEPLSNKVFVVNLCDPETGKNLRDQRLLKDALLGHRPFLSVLTRLEKQDGTEELVRFLTICNIRFDESFRPWRIHTRTHEEPAENGLRRMGGRPVHYFETVHEAAVEFLERHLKRLQHHPKVCSTRSTASFMRIWLSMGYVVRVQERALVESMESGRVLSISQWYALRQKMSRYLDLFREMVHVLCTYLAGRVGLKKLIVPFKTYRNDISDLWNEFHKLSRRFDYLRRKAVRVRNPRGDLVAALTRPEELFSDLNWEPYLTELQRHFACFRRTLSNRTQKPSWSPPNQGE